MRLYTERQKEKGLLSGVAALAIFVLLAMIIAEYMPKIMRLCQALGALPR